MNELIEMYHKFRQELDKMCVPLILTNVWNERIYCDGKLVGIMCANEQYIDCVYILPEYRRKGLAKKVVLEWYEKHKNSPFGIKLHIINNNEVAKKFWNDLFVLTELDRNRVDTLYEIAGRKEEK